MDIKHVDQMLEEAARAAEVIKAQLAGIRDEVHSDLLEGADITVYSQRDPAWAGSKLGTGATTIGGYGCLMTDAASVLTDAGYKVTPLELNAWLIGHGGYTNGNLFVYASIDKLNVVKFYNLVECANIPAPVAQFDSLVKQGDFVIVKVDFDPATMAVEEHWVRYLGDGKMMDPWRGDIASITPRYKGKDAAQAILRAVIYKRVSV